MGQYALYVVNSAPEDLLDFCVYQTPPDSAMPKVQSLAWLVMAAHRGTILHLTWTVSYSFFWARSGILGPGVLVDPSEIVPADLYQNKERTVPDISPEPGTLYVEMTPSIFVNDASIGIGMSGAPAFALQAQPGLLATVTPRPVYRLAAGNYTQGEVLDVEHLTDTVPIEFPDDVFVITATLDGEPVDRLAGPAGGPVEPISRGAPGPARVRRARCATRTR